MGKTNCLSVFDIFVGLALKVLTQFRLMRVFFFNASQYSIGKQLNKAEHRLAMT